MRGKGRDGRTELRGRVVWKSVNNKMEHEGGDEKNESGSNIIYRKQIHCYFKLINHNIYINLRTR